MRLQNNIIAENSHRQIGINSRNLSVNTEKLSSGYRVNRAADDAAGLAISEKMRTQIRGLNRASLNIQDGVSLLQVGDAALQSVHDKMQRLRELSVQSANDTNQLLDREAIQLEFGQLTSEINQVIKMTNFNGRTLFNGDIGASWEYHLGSPVDLPYITSIPAGGDFNPSGTTVDITTWTPITAASTTTSGLGASGTFPLDGLFAMQIISPAPQGTFNVIMDFEEERIRKGGPLDSNDFENFFRNTFNKLSQDEFGLDIVESVTFGPFGGLEVKLVNENGVATGIMGQPVDLPVAMAATPRVIIGAGGNQIELDALMEIESPFYLGPFISNKTLSSISLSDIKNQEIINSPVSAGTMMSAPVGGFPSVTINDGSASTTILLQPGSYTSINDFIKRNELAFASASPRGYTLSEVDGRLSITARSLGALNPPALPLTFNPASLAGQLGFGTLGAVESEPLEAGGLIIQSGANSGDETIIEMPNLSTRALGLSIIRSKDSGNPTSEGYFHINHLFENGYTEVSNIPGNPESESSLDVTSHEKASAALGVLTNAINIISTERARIGAQQNRLEFSMQNVDNSAENLAAAESRIRDVDMAKEMTTFVQNQILVQASTAMLAQANALPNGMLQLLG